MNASGAYPDATIAACAQDGRWQHASWIFGDCCTRPGGQLPYWTLPESGHVPDTKAL